MWWKKHKWKLLLPAALVVILAFAFWYGGDSPDGRGWGLTGGSAAQASPTPGAVTPAPSPSRAQTALPSATPQPPQPTAALPATPTQAPTMTIDPESGKDPYLTDPVPEDNPLPVEPEAVQPGTQSYTCTFSISCASILDNPALCEPEKVELLPEDGWILEPISVTFYEGESVFNVLQRTCKQQGIHMEYSSTPIYNSAYIEGIYNLYEFDAGELSGWIYQVNGWFPNYGCSRYQLQDGDVVAWEYTCDLGMEVSGYYAEGR